MKNFISYKNEFELILNRIISSPQIHVKWVNTLSYLENCGARKIATCEHPILVREEMLKHAAEEFRHAHYLKKQLNRIAKQIPEDYSLKHILGGNLTINYLNWLDLKTCRYLTQNVSKFSLKELSYLLVTYAIELRANELYLAYDEILKKLHSPITVKSILLEEKEHLSDMLRGILNIPEGKIYCEEVCKIESELCCKWLHKLI